MLEICIISLRSKLAKTPLLLLPPVVSIYMNAVPIGGSVVAPESPVGLVVFVDFEKF